MKYNIKSYQTLLRTIQRSGMNFISFSDISNKNNSVLLRHDIDVDMQAAFEMSKIETDLGIKATYFFMLRSPIYNLLGRENFKYAQSIVELGHDVGLHYDQGFDQLSGFTVEETIEKIDEEASFLENQLGVKISSVSFHQPSSVVLDGEIKLKSRINTYDKAALTDYFYLSDSNRRLSLEALDRFLSGDLLRFHNLQLLIHPIWWVYDDEDTAKCWDSGIINNFNIMQRQLLSTEKAFGKKRVFIVRSNEEN